MLDLRQNPGLSAEWFPGSYLRRPSRVLGLPAFFVSANWTGAERPFAVGLDGRFLASSGADALSVHSWVQMLFLGETSVSCPLFRHCSVAVLSLRPAPSRWARWGGPGPGLDVIPCMSPVTAAPSGGWGHTARGLPPWGQHVSPPLSLTSRLQMPARNAGAAPGCVLAPQSGSRSVRPCVYGLSRGAMSLQIGHRSVDVPFAASPGLPSHITSCPREVVSAVPASPPPAHLMAVLIRLCLA